jgi:peptidoglycan/LPS O-acetylase OafA/YrhL
VPTILPFPQRDSEHRPGPPGAFRLGYRPALDGLRALAVLAVLGVHSGLSWAGGGWAGVDVFFVLSGFLITALLLEEWQRTGAISLRRFYLRRALRLLPALFVFLAVCWLFARICLPHWQEVLTRRGVFSALGYYANWRVFRHRDVHDLLPHTWSLSVEEQFYFLWPLALAVLLRLRLGRPALLGVVATAIAGCAVLRGVLWHGSHAFPELYMRLATRADTLLIGCLTALLASWGLLPRAGWGRVLLRLAACAALPYLGCVLVWGRHTSDGWYYGGYTLLAAACAVLVAALVSGPPRALAWLLEARPLVWLGRLSYSLYLWHYPLCLVHGAYLARLGRLLGTPVPEALRLPLLYTAALLAAVLSYYLVEQPFLRLKDRWRRRAVFAPGVEVKRAA